MFTALKIYLFCTCFVSRIREEKEKDYPKSIPLKIIAKDVGTCAYVSAFELSGVGGGGVLEVSKSTAPLSANHL